MTYKLQVCRIKDPNPVSVNLPEHIVTDIDRPGYIGLVQSPLFLRSPSRLAANDVLLLDRKSLDYVDTHRQSERRRDGENSTSFNFWPTVLEFESDGPRGEGDWFVRLVDGAIGPTVYVMPLHRDDQLSLYTPIEELMLFLRVIVWLTQ